MSTNRDLTELRRDEVIQMACRSASNVLVRHGIEPHEIANGLISFGGAMAVELCGVAMAADVFQSKADGLRGKVAN